jgi:hypothetical protein
MHGGTPAALRGQGRLVCWTDAVTSTSWAMAHLNPASARAMAPVTPWACFPCATSRRERVPSRTWACQLRSWMRCGWCSRRRGRCRRTCAGSREAHAPAISARRAWGCPALVIEPGWRRSPEAYAAGVRPRHCISARRVPMGPAGVTDSVSQHEGFATDLGVLAIAEGIFARPRAVPHGFLVDRGNIDCGQLTRAGQAGQLHGVAAVGFAPITGLFGHARRHHPPAGVAFFGSRPVAPGATRACVIEEDEGCGLRWPRADAWSNGTLTGPTSPSGGHRSAVLVRNIGYGTGRFVDIHAATACARLQQG